LMVLDETFSRPTDLGVGVCDKEVGGTIVVRALFTPEVARWVREAPSFFTVAEEETPSGLLVTLRIRQVDEVLQWLLGWGRQVRVLEPESLRRRLADEAKSMLRQHENSC
ncbi:MAG: WYL domain-containing protein, partial [Ktedonobacterales bacterium]|nr:WYL domain-containing protein [Ktedonobacterales bacterium]